MFCECPPSTCSLSSVNWWLHWRIDCFGGGKCSWGLQTFGRIFTCFCGCGDEVCLLLQLCYILYREACGIDKELKVTDIKEFFLFTVPLWEYFYIWLLHAAANLFCFHHSLTDTTRALSKSDCNVGRLRKELPFKHENQLKKIKKWLNKPFLFKVAELSCQEKKK